MPKDDYAKARARDVAKKVMNAGRDFRAERHEERVAKFLKNTQLKPAPKQQKKSKPSRHSNGPAKSPDYWQRNILMTDEILTKGIAGRLVRKQAKVLNLAWPLAENWKTKIIGQLFSQNQIDRFMSLRDRQA